MPGPLEILGLLVLLAILIALPAGLVLVVLIVFRSRRIRRLEGRVARLEAALGGEALTPFAGRGPPPAAARAAVAVEPAAARAPPARPSLAWEMLIGQKALGWASVVVLIFAVGFFLRYAYQNNWVGPLGRVAIGALGGAGLVLAGYRYHQRSWRVLSQMLSAAGAVVLYLIAYAAFGFYDLLPQSHGGVFLALIVAETMAAAALYDSPAIALMAVLGGLLTPLLMISDRDLYAALFTYLAVLDAGVALVALWRAWPIVIPVAMAGGQGIFWSWYAEHYHPEKLAWALGFQLVVYLIFLGHGLGAQWIRGGREHWEAPLRLALNAALWFAAFYVLTREEYGEWMGCAAVGMAVVYAGVARAGLLRRRPNDREVLASLAIAVGFAALAFPIQAEAPWVALGWAAMAAPLWWFGQRTDAPLLRAMAGALAGAALFRVLFVDVFHRPPEPYRPVFNEFALPSIGVAACLLAGLASTRRRARGRRAVERYLAAAAGLAGVLLLWLILSIDCLRYFDYRAREAIEEASSWLWMGQLSLSALWAAYAATVLAAGFRAREAGLRWLAMGLFAATLVKVFVWDMASLAQFYRILAFFILAVFLGLAARAYQKLRVSQASREDEGADHDAT